jgi:hypothetical protein
MSIKLDFVPDQFDLCLRGGGFCGGVLRLHADAVRDDVLAIELTLSGTVTTRISTGSSKHRHTVRDSFTLFHFTFNVLPNTGGVTTIAAGVHDHRFCIAIPDAIPPAFGVAGRVRVYYELFARVRVKGFFSVDPRASVALPVIGSFSPQLFAQFSTPQCHAAQKKFFAAAGLCKANVKLLNGSAHAGGSLAGVIQLQNGSTKKIDSIKLRFVQEIVYRARHLVRKETLVLCRAVLSNAGFAGNADFQLSFEFVVVPNAELVPTVHSGTGNLFEVHHRLEVQFDAAWAVDLVVTVPVCISLPPDMLKPMTPTMQPLVLATAGVPPPAYNFDSKH